jgi:transcriptional regulator with XRE-family HTH domain
MQIEDAFRKARERAGLSQAGLASELGCTQQSISKWEGGFAKPEPDKVSEMDGLLEFTEAERRAISSGYPRVFEDIPAGFRKKWSSLSTTQRKKVTSFLDKVAAGKA